MLLAFFINMAIGAVCSMVAYTVSPETRSDIEALKSEKPLTQFLVLTRGFVINHWILMFDFLISLTLDEEDDDDETNTPT